MIRCPFCRGLKTPVISHYSRRNNDFETIRYRRCGSCGKVIKTHEWIVENKEMAQMLSGQLYPGQSQCNVSITGK